MGLTGQLIISSLCWFWDPHPLPGLIKGSIGGRSEVEASSFCSSSSRSCYKLPLELPVGLLAVYPPQSRCIAVRAVHQRT